MSLWGVHVGIAVIFTSLIVGYFRLPWPVRWKLVVASGVFATVPDWHWAFTDRVLPGLQLPWLAEAYRALLHNSVLADLFWFHGVIDTFGTDDVLSSVVVGAVSVVVFLLVEYNLARETRPLPE